MAVHAYAIFYYLIYSLYKLICSNRGQVHTPPKIITSTIYRKFVLVRQEVRKSGSVEVIFREGVYMRPYNVPPNYSSKSRP